MPQLKPEFANTELTEADPASLDDHIAAAGSEIDAAGFIPITSLSAEMTKRYERRMLNREKRLLMAILMASETHFDEAAQLIDLIFDRYPDAEG